MPSPGRASGRDEFSAKVEGVTVAFHGLGRPFDWEGGFPAKRRTLMLRDVIGPRGWMEKAELRLNVSRRVVGLVAQLKPGDVVTFRARRVTRTTWGRGGRPLMTRQTRLSHPTRLALAARVEDN
jgi:hypothetical protein